MCNVSQGIAEDAYYRGIEQGIAQGMAQGIEQNQVDVIKRLMAQLSMSLDEVMKILGIADDEKEKYRGLINGSNS